MTINKPKLIPLAVLALSILSISARPVRAEEAYFYRGTAGFAKTFYLLGGQYSLYVYAARPLNGNTPESRSCLFGGVFERISPTPNSMSLGSGITISTIVPHKIGPQTLTLIAGVYHLYVPTLTTCEWKFVINSTNQNTAGVQPVQMYNLAKGSAELSATASVKDRVEFYAQYRTEHDAQAPVSGVLQTIHDGKVIQTFPLRLDKDRLSGATALFVDVQFSPDDLKYLGANTVKFVVQIGAATFTSTGDFKLIE
jgi:hypothetical protein